MGWAMTRNECDRTDYEIATTPIEMLSPEERQRVMQFSDSHWVRAIDRGPERKRARPSPQVTRDHLLERIERLEALVHQMASRRDGQG
jgi:hypothetical protein